jgi:hydrogenase maturation protease
VLVIAYGNPLREDDGVGWAVAAAVERCPGVEVKVVHQLLPELVEPLSRASSVVFVDARNEGRPGSVHREPVLALAGAEAMTHTLDPGRLLGLCLRLYGRAPEAVAVSVAGARFGFGHHLSEPVRRAVPEAARCVLRPVARSDGRTFPGAGRIRRKRPRMVRQAGLLSGRAPWARTGRRSR